MFLSRLLFYWFAGARTWVRVTNNLQMGFNHILQPDGSDLHTQMALLLF